MNQTIRLRALHRQINRLQQRLEQLRRTSQRYAQIRLAIFVAGLLASGAAFYWIGGWLAWSVLGVGLLLFGLAVFYHRRIDASLTRHEVWRQLKLAQIARMELDWANVAQLSWGQPRYDHPFEADLDLVGERSLHHLLDRAVSLEGSHLLRDWLTTPVPELAQIRRRQQLIRELTPLSLFRDKLILNATVAAGASKMWDANRLLAWLDRHTPTPSLRLWLLLFTVWVGLNLLLFGLNSLGLAPPVWQISLLLYFGLLLLANSRLTGNLFHEAQALQETLQQLSAVFRQLENFSYRQTPQLKSLCAPFLNRAQHPSAYVAHMSRIVAATGLRGNPLIWLGLNLLFPWDFYFAHRLNRAKVELAQYAPEWLQTWFELEALSSLANLAYLNPAYGWPYVFEVEKGVPVLQAQGLGHPLLPDETKVCNDFAMTNLGEVAIITGSNMAGKSTFLRTVGVNLALAYAGGPVNAQSLQTGLFRLFTCIKVSDSVTDGISYFYAEVKRLRALLSALEADHPLPLCFFIDEIFRGTNNRERFLGSRAYLRTLAGQHGIGLLSTHDLELAKLADQVPQLKNYHFKDDFIDSQMVFDYTLRPGPCPTTNALKIMQMEGLPVGQGDELPDGSSQTLTGDR